MNNAQRALQIWPILINAAHNRQVLTYKAVGDLIGMPPIALSQPLGLIMNYCRDHKLPPLTILVVSEKTGQPGEGLTTVNNVGQDRERVYSLNWYGREPLEIKDLNAEPQHPDAEAEDIVGALLAFEKKIDPAELIPTLEPQAGEFVLDHPFAFAIAICLDRGTKAEIIWTIPYYLYQELGHLDPYEIDLLSMEQLAEVITRLPRKPRYTSDAPRTIKELTHLVVSKYDGEAAKIWMDQSASDVNSFFQSIFGVGPGIASMGVLLIEKAYGLRFSDMDRHSMDIKPDVHTMRVLFRLGVSAEVTESAAIDAARKLNPEFPGEIDGALWTIGRTWCHAQNPDCDQCPLDKVCQKSGV